MKEEFNTINIKEFLIKELSILKEKLEKWGELTEEEKEFFSNPDKKNESKNENIIRMD